VTIGDAVSASAAYLARKGVPSPRVDAEHLVARGLGLTRLDLYLQYDRPLGENEIAACRELVRRRGAREPLAYILGEWGFRRLTLKVDHRVLIPRPETEVVVERCLALLEGVERPRVLDVGTGSGAIALAIADERPDAVVGGLDVSGGALALAVENAERTGLASRVDFELHDVTAPGLLPGQPYDLVVSNPPYVEPEELEALQPEVRDWEPTQALVGRGMTELVARKASDVLRPRGALVVEVADGTAAAVSALLSGLGYRDVVATPDLAGRDRVVEGRWTP
jgi:release factor glutamine methyltransferase